MNTEPTSSEAMSRPAVAYGDVLGVPDDVDLPLFLQCLEDIFRPVRSRKIIIENHNGELDALFDQAA